MHQTSFPRLGSSDTSSSSGSASDATADATDLVGIVEDDSAVTDAGWFRQSKKVHAVRECVESRPSPWCRDAPFAQEPVERSGEFVSQLRPAPTDWLRW